MNEAYGVKRVRGERAQKNIAAVCADTHGIIRRSADYLRDNKAVVKMSVCGAKLSYVTGHYLRNVRAFCEGALRTV